MTASSPERTDVLWGTEPQPEWIPHFEEAVSCNLGAYRHRQRLPTELIQNGQRPVALSIAELAVNEVDGPDIVWIQTESQTLTLS